MILSFFSFFLAVFANGQHSDVSPDRPSRAPSLVLAPLPAPLGNPLPSWLLPGGGETKAPSLDQAMTCAHWSFYASLSFLPLSD